MSAKKRWGDNFATVKRLRDGFGAYLKEKGCHPASTHALIITLPIRCSRHKSCTTQRFTLLLLHDAVEQTPSGALTQLATEPKQPAPGT
jgi:hypothetical protein